MFTRARGQFATRARRLEEGKRFHSEQACDIVPVGTSRASMSFLTSLFRRAAPLIRHDVPSTSRARGDLAPRRTKYKKAHKGRVPLPTGGSTKGTTLVFGDYGIRIAGDVSARITAKQLKSADAALKKKLKVIKGVSVWLRVFPDIPVCVKVRRLFSGNPNFTN